MSPTVQVPRAVMETVASLRLPAEADKRLQYLMDRNTEGVLTVQERKELQELVDWSESLSLIRADAMNVLGRKPA